MRGALLVAIGLLALGSEAVSAQVEVTRASPTRLRIQAGGERVALTIEGADLDAVTDARVLRSGRVVAEVRAVIQPALGRSVPTRGTTTRGATLALSLGADGSAPAGRYELELVAGHRTIAVPIQISVDVLAPSVSAATPAGVTLDAGGATRVVALTGTRLDELTDAWVERNGVRLEGRVRAVLREATDPGRREVAVTAFANAGPPWGDGFDLVLEATPEGVPTKVAAPVGISVPPPPVDLTMGNCSFDTTGLTEGVRARARVVNAGSQPAVFSSGQVIASASGLGSPVAATAPGGGRSVPAGGSLEVEAYLSLANVPAGDQAVVWNADPDGLVVERNDTNNGTWCSFVWAPPPPRPRATPEKPDFVISQLTVTPRDGGPDTHFEIVAQIENIGSAPPPPDGGRAYVVYCRINGAELATGEWSWSRSAYYDFLEPGESGTWTIPLEPGLAPGTKTLECTVDPAGLASELSEDNNDASLWFVVTSGT